MSDILLTGASGFIGQPLTKRLVAIPFTRADGDIAKDSESLFQACEGVSKLIHLAYPADYENPTGEAMAMLLNVLAVCKQRGIHLFLASSWRVFDGALGVVTDQSHPSPETPYGIAKLEEELAARSSGVKLTIIRLAAVYGPRHSRPRVIRDFARAIRVGETVRPHRFENGYPEMNLLHVSDAVSGIAKIVETGREGVFHLSGQKPVSTPEIARMIAANLGRSAVIEDNIQPGSMRHVAFEASRDFEAKRSLMAGLGELAFEPA